MTTLELYFAPSTCARVPLIALEEIGLPYKTRLVRFMMGEHKSADYRKLNPKGKVPTLLIGQQALTENVAILSYLNSQFPESGLLPPCDDETARLEQIADLCFCATTLHPLVTRIRLPSFIAGPANALDVWEKACSDMAEYFQVVENRLQKDPWWYGQSWSVMDAYLNWVFWRVEGAGFNTSPYSAFCEHAAKMKMRPSVIRAMEIEQEATELLRSEGLEFTPPPLPER